MPNQCGSPLRYAVIQCVCNKKTASGDFSLGRSPLCGVFRYPGAGLPVPSAFHSMQRCEDGIVCPSSCLLAAG